MLVVHQFGDDGLAGGGPGFLQKFQPLGPQPLETVGTGPGFESAAPQNTGPRRLYPFGHFQNLVPAFHTAGAAHHRKVSAADLVAAHIHHGVVRVELAVGFLVGLADTAAGVHHRVGQHPAFSQGLGVADQAQDVGIVTGGIVDLKPHAPQFFAEAADLFFGGVLFQYDNHGGNLPLCCWILRWILTL